MKSHTQLQLSEVPLKQLGYDPGLALCMQTHATEKPTGTQEANHLNSQRPGHRPDSYRSKRGQKGEAEMMIFGLVVVVAVLFSGTVWLLTWIKHNKYSEREARKLVAIMEKKASQFSGRRDPAEYLVFCDKPAWSLLQTKYHCEILPESYGELFLMP